MYKNLLLAINLILKMSWCSPCQPPIYGTCCTPFPVRGATGPTGPVGPTGPSNSLQLVASFTGPQTLSSSNSALVFSPSFGSLTSGTDFITPVSGWYQITGSLGLTISSTGGVMEFFVVDTTSATTIYECAPSLGYPTNSQLINVDFTTYANLTAGDHVQIQGAAAPNETISNTFTNSSTWGILKMG